MPASCQPDRRLAVLRAPAVARPGNGPLPDHRIIALARAVCAPKAPLRRPFLRGRWRAAHIERVAGAIVALGIQRGDIEASSKNGAVAYVMLRLAELLAHAPSVADGLNGLAEFIGGRSANHRDRLTLIAPEQTLTAQAAPLSAGQHVDGPVPLLKQHRFVIIATSKAAAGGSTGSTSRVRGVQVEGRQGT